jgi:hypothetical protein
MKNISTIDSKSCEAKKDQFQKVPLEYPVLLKI